MRELPEPRRAKSIRGDDAEALRRILEECEPYSVAECGVWPGGSRKVIQQFPVAYEGWEKDQEWAEEMGCHHGHIDTFDADVTLLDCGPEYEARQQCLERWLAAAKRGACCIVDDAEAMGLTPTHGRLALIKAA